MSHDQLMDEIGVNASRIIYVEPAVNLLHPDPHQTTMAPMTVCIAAICESGKAIIIAADRLSWLSYGSLETEIGGKKFSFLGDHIAMLNAGVTSNSADALAKFKANRGGAGNSVREIASRLHAICQEIRLEQAEDRFIRRPYGMTFAEFQKSAMGTDPRFSSVYVDVGQFPIELSLIAAGIDIDGAHLHIITDSANNSFSDTGFAAIGTGSVQAFVSLARRGHSKLHSLAQALYAVYESKRHSELAQGVGPSTDMAIIRDGQPKTFVSDATLRALEEVYQRMRPPVLSEDDAMAINATFA